jgi:hypothetical protein
MGDPSDRTCLTPYRLPTFRHPGGRPAPSQFQGCDQESVRASRPSARGASGAAPECAADRGGGLPRAVQSRRSRPTPLALRLRLRRPAAREQRGAACSTGRIAFTIAPRIFCRADEPDSAADGGSDRHSAPARFRSTREGGTTTAVRVVAVLAPRVKTPGAD